MSDLLEKHKVFRRLVLIWVAWIITEVLFTFMDEYEATELHQATVIVAVLALLTLAAKFLKGEEL